MLAYRRLLCNATYMQTRPDLINPYEKLPESIMEPFPVYGSPVVDRSRETGSRKTELHFIELTDPLKNPMGLLDRIGSAEIIVYCSNWGYGEKGESGMGPLIEDGMNAVFSDERATENDTDDCSKHGPVLGTLLMQYQNSGRQFYAAGKYDIYEESDIEDADLAAAETLQQYHQNIFDFAPPEVLAESLGKHIAARILYGNAVSQKASEEIADIVHDNPGEEIAVIIDPIYQVLPRFIPGIEGITMRKSRMPWDQLITEFDFYGDQKSETMELVRNGAPELAANRFWVDRLTYLGQLGVTPPEYYQSFAIMSDLDHLLISQGSRASEYDMEGFAIFDGGAYVDMPQKFLRYMVDPAFADIRVAVAHGETQRMLKILRVVAHEWHGIRTQLL